MWLNFTLEFITVLTHRDLTVNASEGFIFRSCLSASTRFCPPTDSSSCFSPLITRWDTTKWDKFTWDFSQNIGNKSDKKLYSILHSEKHYYIDKNYIYLHERSLRHLLSTDSSTEYRLANEGAFHILQLLAVNLVTLNEIRKYKIIWHKSRKELQSWHFPWYLRKVCKAVNSRWKLDFYRLVQYTKHQKPLPNILHFQTILKIWNKTSLLVPLSEISKIDHSDCKGHALCLI